MKKLLARNALFTEAGIPSEKAMGGGGTREVGNTHQGTKGGETLKRCSDVLREKSEIRSVDVKKACAE